MQEFEELGKIMAQGILEGMKSVDRERTANNALKMSGVPMRRKKSKRDNRGKIRRSIINMEHVLKNLRRVTTCRN